MKVGDQDEPAGVQTMAMKSSAGQESVQASLAQAKVPQVGSVDEQVTTTDTKVNMATTVMAALCRHGGAGAGSPGPVAEFV